MIEQRPSTGDEAVGVAISNLLSAMFLAVFALSGRSGAQTLVNMFDQLNEKLIAPGPFLERLQAGVATQRAVLEQMP